jgi:hypothetical protein
MTGERAFLGIDPGPTTGIVLWVPGLAPMVAQCNVPAVGLVVLGLFEAQDAAPGGLFSVVYGQVERFVTRAVSAKAGRNGDITRKLIQQVTELTREHPSVVSWRERSASEVKPWAMDERLDAAGLLAPTKGMPHARDAARHALFTAVRDGGVPDPLSKRSRS